MTSSRCESYGKQQNCKKRIKLPDDCTLVHPHTLTARNYYDNFYSYPVFFLPSLTHSSPFATLKYIICIRLCIRSGAEADIALHMCVCQSAYDEYYNLPNYCKFKLVYKELPQFPRCLDVTVPICQSRGENVSILLQFVISAPL